MAAVLIPLIFTVPSTSQLRYIQNDSLMVHCSGGPETRDLSWVRIYRLPISGGAWTCTDSLNVRGREGTEDTIWVDPGAGAHFYATAVDTAGNESCASDAVYWGPATSVPETAEGHKSLTVRYFDVHGRAVRMPLASGVYYWIAVDSRGRFVKRGKTVILR